VNGEELFVVHKVALSRVSCLFVLLRLLLRLRHVSWLAAARFGLRSSVTQDDDVFVSAVSSPRLAACCPQPSAPLFFFCSFWTCCCLAAGFCCTPNRRSKLLGVSEVLPHPGGIERVSILAFVLSSVQVVAGSPQSFGATLVTFFPDLASSTPSRRVSS
jgi:hypothetical protein